MTKHIFVTGGVVSSLGKGLTASSLGALLKARGLRVTMQKLDPYLNVDPGTMNPFEHGERLFRLSEANVRINESLDFDTVLQGILDSARSLTGARFGLLVLADESGREQNLLVSGLAAHEHQRFMEWFKAEEVLFECLNRIPGPLRSKDFNSDAKAAGFPAFRPPVESVKCPMAYLTAPILHRGASVRYTRHALATAGYAPIVTGDPGDVPRIIRAKNPRLVLLDLMLPGSNGIELMGRILNITDVPVVFMSAYAQDDVIARALDTGAVDYIVKPFSPTELVARIRAALRERSALHHGDLPEPYVFAELTVDFAERRVTLSGQPRPVDQHRVPVARRTLEERRTGRYLRSTAAAGLESRRRHRHAADAHSCQEPAAGATSASGARPEQTSARGTTPRPIPSASRSTRYALPPGHLIRRRVRSADADGPNIANF